MAHCLMFVKTIIIYSNVECCIVVKIRDIEELVYDFPKRGIIPYFDRGFFIQFKKPFIYLSIAPSVKLKQGLWQLIFKAFYII